jgi:cytochrome c oxidase assembly protein subunit 15
LLIGIAVVWTSVKLIRSTLLPNPVRVAGAAWIFLIFVQLVLGAWTVLSNKAADIATAHVLGGALMLVIGVLLSVALSRILACKDKRTAGGSRAYSMEIGKV